MEPPCDGKIGSSNKQSTIVNAVIIIRTLAVPRSQYDKTTENYSGKKLQNSSNKSKAYIRGTNSSEHQMIPRSPATCVSGC